MPQKTQLESIIVRAANNAALTGSQEQVSLAGYSADYVRQKVRQYLSKEGLGDTFKVSHKGDEIYLVPRESRNKKYFYIKRSKSSSDNIKAALHLHGEGLLPIIFLVGVSRIEIDWVVQELAERPEVVQLNDGVILSYDRG